MSLKITPYIERSKPGTSGTPILILSSYFPIEFFGQENIHHYDILIDGDQKSPPALNRKLWKVFKDDQQGQGLLHHIGAVYDGRKNMYTCKPLKLNSERQSFKVNQSHPHPQKKARRQNENPTLPFFCPCLPIFSLFHHISSSHRCKKGDNRYLGANFLMLHIY